MVMVYDIVVFEGPPKTEQKMWPTHCVQVTTIYKHVKTPKFDKKCRNLQSREKSRCPIVTSKAGAFIKAVHILLLHTATHTAATHTVLNPQR